MTTAIESKQEVIDAFHRVWYDAARDGLTWGSTTYFGHTMWKSPLDMHLYQELIYRLRPALIIETGTAFGGSALYYAHLLDQIGSGEVLSIDLKPISKEYPRHPRISFLGGHSSTDKHVLQRARGLADFCNGPVLVVLDSDHSKQHVLAEMDAYAPLVTPGSYMVVEDVNVNGHPVFPEHGEGPFEAVAEWLPIHREFSVDERLPARMLFSFHHWLSKRRV